MGELILVRHGQASFGADDYDKLSDLGHRQALWLGQYLKEHEIAFDAIYRGGLRRHVETAARICEGAGLADPTEDRRFDELHYDALEREYLEATGSNAPSNRAHFIEHFPELFTRWAKGDIGGSSESFVHFEARVLTATDEAAREGARVLIVTSGGVIGVILRRALGLSARDTANLLINIHNASLHQLNIEFGVQRLSLFNASPHLEMQDRRHARTYV